MTEAERDELRRHLLEWGWLVAPLIRDWRE
jgi:hypothetical protein